MKKAKEIYNTLSNDTQIALQFCLECECLCYYADNDTCSCGTSYNPENTGGDCLECRGDSDCATRHCSECGAAMDACYLDSFFRDPEMITDRQWGRIEKQLKKFKK